jgi:hypothetical protein
MVRAHPMFACRRCIGLIPSCSTSPSGPAVVRQCASRSIDRRRRQTCKAAESAGLHLTFPRRIRIRNTLWSLFRSPCFPRPCSLQHTDTAQRSLHRRGQSSPSLVPIQKSAPGRPPQPSCSIARACCTSQIFSPTLNLPFFPRNPIHGILHFENAYGISIVSGIVAIHPLAISRPSVPSADTQPWSSPPFSPLRFPIVISLQHLSRSSQLSDWSAPTPLELAFFHRTFNHPNSNNQSQPHIHRRRRQPAPFSVILLRLKERICSNHGSRPAERRVARGDAGAHPTGTSRG